METEKIQGPPGTGKTATLMMRLVDELHDVSPHRIGFYSFTKAAAREFGKRTQEIYPEYGKDDFPHFRTIHSECYRLLGMTKEKLMDDKKFKLFGKAYGYDFSANSAADDGEPESEFREVVLKSSADWLKFFHDWQRSLMLPLEEAFVKFWDRNGAALPPYWTMGLIEQYIKRYEEFKKEAGLHDFHDMLQEVLKEGLRPDLDVLILDEAQDCSKLLFRVVDHFLASGVKRHYLGADPDQSIFAWNGAAPELFEGRHCDQYTVLRQSWRLPKAVHRVATRILNTVEYEPRPEEGKVERAYLEAFLHNLDKLEGSVFILVRNLYLLPMLCDELYRFGIHFYNLRGPSPSKGTQASRYLTLMHLLEGKNIRADRLYQLIKDVRAKEYLARGFKSKVESLARDFPWLTYSLDEIRQNLTDRFINEPWALLDLSPQKLAFYRRVLDRGGEDALLETPRVTTGTIHSVKGMEKDIVAILSDVSRRTFDNIASVEEARVWYVGATRAKYALYPLYATGIYEYKWPRG